MAKITESLMKISDDWRFLPCIPAITPALTLLSADIPAFVEQKTDTAYELIAIPQGLENVSEAVWSKTYQSLRSGGTLYVGFSGRGSYLWKKRPFGPPSTPQKISRQLRQAGYQQITVYGIFPNHLLPTHIFPLRPAMIRFVLPRYLKKIRPPFLRTKLIQIISQRGHALFPAYAIVAVKTDSPPC